MTETHATSSDCIFCAIATGTMDADIVKENDRIIAFRDINPQAEMHVLVIPRAHHGDVVQLAKAAPETLAELVTFADEIASELADGQFRFIFNSGPQAGQSVFHVHGHVLGGQRLGWTPA
ncbi:HIT domain-containing protein [Jonesia denitrificans]|uniref:Histidine triad (HIT) protein n=1 Tax=Jonesia denitrificans (strain ATCC 14870 / DSM 20603 / BCRC 15368 / CIP 55.134 / JCM 11481 / NBRC 15587 / NCTC 10816 / Prevot 55134) TaxID=471856 RepID=C7R525_JONDD|nr:HIT domain-containing protein [Jonesia denitrificans]ACV09195.1 histidine triad (HIT) protein [Jonesia denitrificans DSM 20603]ASE09531.1 HIT domain-containing protein [Jonesia denitrificans]QXB44075.1 HIT domain-containing protein [Jonesia denitrificans]SQH21426.1 HIT-like protein HI_0961 [Jonesia denitrificans]